MEFVSPEVREETINILEESIKDIKEHRWICNELVGGNFHNEEKPMGCAIGLVGINSGAGRLVTDKNYGSYYYMAYPKEEPEKWSEAAMVTIRFLAETTRWERGAREAAGVAEESRGNSTDEVILYNDGGEGGENISSPKALAWFKRALKLAQEQPLN
jgi:hypothetical protein